MKKALFIAILMACIGFFVEEIVIPTYAEARHDCVQQVTRYQTNWICGNELFTGHIGTGYGHGGYNAPSAPNYGYSYRDGRRHGGRHYDNNGFAGDIVGGVIGGIVAGIILNNNQPATPPPVYYPASPPVSYSPPPVYTAPAPTLARSCGSTTCIYVSGGSDEAVRAVKRALLDRSYTVVNSRGDADYEIVVSERHIGDPTVRVYLEMVEVHGNKLKSTSTGEERYPRGSELKKLDAVAKAAADAVGKL